MTTLPISVLIPLLPGVHLAGDSQPVEGLSVLASAVRTVVGLRWDHDLRCSGSGVPVFNHWGTSSLVAPCERSVFLLAGAITIQNRRCFATRRTNVRQLHISGFDVLKSYIQCTYD
jgi:hypothetical protein